MSISDYDNSNIFARVLRGEIPARVVYEDDYVVAFHDIAPQAPVHILIIPRNAYTSFADFSAHAPADEIVGFTHSVNKIANLMNLTKSGYRLLTNVGPDSGQEVPHYHVHLCGGAPLGPLIDKKS